MLVLPVGLGALLYFIAGPGRRGYIYAFIAPALCLTALVVQADLTMPRCVCEEEARASGAHAVHVVMFALFAGGLGLVGALLARWAATSGALPRTSAGRRMDD